MELCVKMANFILKIQILYLSIIRCVGPPFQILPQISLSWDSDIC